MNRSLVALLVLALGAGTLAYGQPNPQRGERERTRQRLEPLAERLNLSDEQKTQMHQIRIAHQKQQVQREAKVKLARIELKELMAADDPNRSAIEKKTKEISDLQYQAKLEMIDHLFKVRSILTPEQREIFKGHMLRGGRGGRGPRPGMRGCWGGCYIDPEPVPDLGFMDEELVPEDEEPRQ